jgi:hypothetical protein
MPPLGRKFGRFAHDRGDKPERFLQRFCANGGNPRPTKNQSKTLNPLPIIQLVSNKLFASFNAKSPKGSLAKLAASLLEQQKQTWSQLADGYAACASAKYREIECDGFSIKLQHNPQRIVSTGAKVDSRTIRERECFLCLQNLPEKQRAIAYDEDFLILCNPIPIFERHYTVSHVKHTPQSLESHLETFLSLAQDLSPTFAVFYNGPECGASAPDHMHFQMSPAGAIPIEQDAERGSRRISMKTTDSVAYSTLRNYGRSVLILESTVNEALVSSIAKLLGAMRGVFATAREPMLNVLCSFRSGVWRLIVFPRAKHRPDVYFRPGKGQVLISPALVDMGGIVVTPVKKDFDDVDAKMMESILQEVSISDQKLEEIVDAV